MTHDHDLSRAAGPAVLTAGEPRADHCARFCSGRKPPDKLLITKRFAVKGSALDREDRAWRGANCRGIHRWQPKRGTTRANTAPRFCRRLSRECPNFIRSHREDALFFGRIVRRRRFEKPSSRAM